MGLRIVFAGTPQVALPTLEALNESAHEIVGVITRSPKRQGRSKVPMTSEVGRYAEQHGLALLQTDRPADPEAMAWLSERKADLGVVVAYGAILPQRLLDLLPLGWINLHFSSLPDLRGAAPVQRAIARGDHELGCSVFALEAGMDTGPIITGARFDVDPEMSAGDALAKLAEASTPLVIGAVNSLEDGTAIFQAQQPTPESPATYAAKLTREDAFISFCDRATETVNRARAVTPDPGPWTTLPDGSTMKLRGLHIVTTRPAHADPTVSPPPGTVRATKSEVGVVCADGLVRVDEVAPAGRKWMRATDWWRGARLADDTRLGQRTAPSPSVATEPAAGNEAANSKGSEDAN